MSIIIYVSEDKLFILFEPQIYSGLMVCHGTMVGTGDIKKRTLTLTFPEGLHSLFLKCVQSAVWTLSALGSENGTNLGL